MSIKIHNAYKYDGDVISAFNFFKKLKSEIIALCSEQTVKYISREYYSYRDSVLMGHDKHVDEHFGFTIDIDDVYMFTSYMDKKIKEMESSTLRSDGDYSVSVSIFPYDNEATYFIVYCNNNTISEYIYNILSKSSSVSDFSYYNHVDHPENISEEEWDARYEMWKTLMPSLMPRNSSMSFILSNYDIVLESFGWIIPVEKIKEFEPDIQLRAKDYAKNELIYEIIESNGQKLEWSNICAALKELETNSKYNEMYKIKFDEILKKIK